MTCSDALWNEPIDAKDILEEERIYPPEGLGLVEEALWKERSKVLYTRISASLHYSVRKVADSLETKGPVAMWKALSDEFGVCKAEERFNLVKPLRELSIQSNDYLQYYRIFQNL
jgi:hypothetical protein